MTAKVAALFVEAGGVYFGRDDVDPWDITRDARKYAGPWPVVAHPPCERWCRMAPLVHRTHGYLVGDDGQCFAAALWAVRTFGGVLEHPELSLAFPFYGIAKPAPSGWSDAKDGHGMVCRVEQGHYGHRARKGTWLYAAKTSFPDLMWGKSNATAYVTDGGGAVKRGACGTIDPSRKRLGQREAAATPPAFAELLIGIAKSAKEPA